MCTSSPRVSSRVSSRVSTPQTSSPHHAHSLHATPLFSAHLLFEILLPPRNSTVRHAPYHRFVTATDSTSLSSSSFSSRVYSCGDPSRQNPFSLRAVTPRPYARLRHAPTHVTPRPLSAINPKRDPTFVLDTPVYVSKSSAQLPYGVTSPLSTYIGIPFTESDFLVRPFHIVNARSQSPLPKLSCPTFYLHYASHV